MDVTRTLLLLLLLFVINGLRLVSSSGSVNSTTVLRLSPPTGVMVTGKEIKTIKVTGKTSLANLTNISVRIKDGTVAKISGNSSAVLQPIDCAALNDTLSDADNGIIIKQDHCFNFSFAIQGIFLGRSDVEFHADHTSLLAISYNVAVLRPYNIANDIFTYSVIVLVALNTIGFGCSIDLSEMWKIMKKPIPPAIGLGCQFIINPLISYGLGKAIGISLALALGLFALGCCPGGGSSNMWTYLLDGDLNLSILMTFISTVVSFGTMPLWMYTLGKTLIPENVTIPFDNIFFSLVGLVVPCVIGILIKRFAPKAAKYFRKWIKPVAFLAILITFSLGIYANLYMFTLLQNWRVLVCGCLSPYLAYIISAIIAWSARQTPARILTISIETAVQNTAIAIVIILTTFPQPEADIAAVMPVAAVTFTPFPLIIIIVIKTIRKRCRQSKAEDGSNFTTDHASPTGSYTKHPNPDEKYGVDNVTFVTNYSNSEKVTGGNSS